MMFQIESQTLKLLVWALVYWVNNREGRLMSAADAAIESRKAYVRCNPGLEVG